MWRAFFLSLGIYLCFAGLECLVMDKAVLAGKPQMAQTLQGPAIAQPKEVTPPEWAPWSLLSGGAVTILYSLTLRRGGGH